MKASNLIFFALVVVLVIACGGKDKDDTTLTGDTTPISLDTSLSSFNCMVERSTSDSRGYNLEVTASGGSGDYSVVSADLNGSSVTYTPMGTSFSSEITLDVSSPNADNALGGSISVKDNGSSEVTTCSYTGLSQSFLDSLNSTSSNSSSSSSSSSSTIVADGCKIYASNRGMPVWRGQIIRMVAVPTDMRPIWLTAMTAPPEAMVLARPLGGGWIDIMMRGTTGKHMLQLEATDQQGQKVQCGIEFLLF